jgi:hypothetical protein
MKFTRFLFLLIMTLSLTFVGPLLAQGGGGGGGKGGGGGRPGGEESTTNLSYPAYFYGTSLQTGIIGSSTLDGVFPAAMSYGCLAPETIGTSTYPNTSCVDTTGVPQDYDTCVARCAAIDPLLPVERIYWQKNVNNKWQAGYGASGSTPLAAEYIDWGDNLEGRT